MRVLLLIALGTISCSAQDFGQQTNQLSDKNSVRPSGGRVTSVDISPPRFLAVSAATHESPLGTTNPAAGEPLVIAPVQSPALTLTTKPNEKGAEDRKRVWMTLVALQHGSAAFDAWSTRQSLLSGNGYERDPLMKPFAGSAAIYPALQILPIGLDYLSKRMMRSPNAMVRHLWWVPLTVSTTGFVWSGARNLHVAALRLAPSRGELR